MNTFNLRNLSCHLLLASLLFNVACTKSNGPSEPEDIVVVHGNPLTLIEGTDIRSTPNLPSSLFRDGKKFFLLPRGFVRESRLRRRTTWEQVKENNRTDKMSRAQQNEMLETLSLVASFNAERTAVILRNSRYGFVFSNRDGSGNWKFESIIAEQKTFTAGQDYENVHYSHRADGTFSVLIREQEEAITSFVFMPFQGGSNFAEDGSPYQYLYGKGFPVAWKDTNSLNVVFCHPNEKRFEKLTQESLDAWKEPLKNRLNLSMRTKRCHPFSDVNEKGIFLVDVYMMQPHTKTSGTGGITLPNFDPTIGKLYDSDIFIMRSELYSKRILDTSKQDAYSSEEQKTLLKRIIVHELGHLFGIGHNFDSPSIMNYDYEKDELTSYDVAAVQHLYPLKRPPNPLPEDNPDEQ